MKKYYLDIDYHLHFLDFPHMGVAGAIFWNSDCTAEIYINSLYTHERQMQTARHELRHFVYDHAHCSHKDIATKEAEADNDCDKNVVFADDLSWVIILDEQKAYAS